MVPVSRLLCETPCRRLHSVGPEVMKNVSKESASLQLGQELHRWVGDGALHLKRNGSHSDSQRRWEAVRERAGKTPYELSSPRLAGPEGPGQCHFHFGLAQIAPIAAPQIEPPLHPAYSESLQGGALL